MTRRAAARAATFALFATALCVAGPTRMYGQSVECDRGDLEVRSLQFRGNKALSSDDLALRVVTTASAWARRHLNLWFSAKRCLNRTELANDIVRLKLYYKERGFPSTEVDTVVETIGPSAVRVIFNIQEGKPPLVATYAVTGLTGVPDSADILGHLRLQVGRPLDLALFQADIDTILQRLRNEGFYRADAHHAYDWETTHVAHASIEVIPGKRARFGVPQYFVTPAPDRGQQIKDDVLHRLIGISPGDGYSDRAIIDAQRNLFQLGAYRHVEVAPLPDSLQPPGDTIVVLAVRLSEDYMRQLDSELGWATLDCGKMRLQFTDKNLFGTARRLQLTGQASKIGFGRPLEWQSTRDLCALGGPIKSDSQFSDRLHYYTGLAVQQPRLLGTRWVPTVTLYSERRGEYRAYLRSTEIGGDFAAIREIGDRIPFRLGYTIEYGKTEAPDAAFCALFNRCDQQSRERLSKLATLGVASATLARIRTDNMINPSSGIAMRGEVRTSASRFLGTSDSLFFNKGTGDIAWYVPFGYRDVLALRLRAGAVLGRSLSFAEPSGFVPPQERLYAGGPTSVRGFQQNELGSLVYIARPSEIDIFLDGVGNALDTTATPIDTSRNYGFKIRAANSGPDRVVPLGGNSLLVANIEYRLRDPFFFPDLVQYALFVDGGDVWTRGGSTGRDMRIKWTPGFGIRAITAVGPIQVNVGWNEYPRDDGAIYHNPDVTTLLCVSPRNGLLYRRQANQWVQQASSATCPASYTPPQRTGWQRLTFTFSIGPEF